MKRFFALAVTAAVTMMAVACGSNEPKELDTLSYAVGADLGLNLSLGMGDYNLDNDIVIDNITDFYFRHNNRHRRCRGIHKGLPDGRPKGFIKNACPNILFRRRGKDRPTGPCCGFVFANSRY